MLTIKFSQITEKIQDSIDPYNRHPVIGLSDEAITGIVNEMVAAYTFHAYHTDKIQLYLDIMDVMCTVLATGACKVRFAVWIDGNIKNDYIIFTF